MSEVRCIQQSNAILGEGPIWHAAEAVLYWVDIKRPAIFRYDPSRGQTGHWPMPREVGCAALTQSSHRLVFADSDGFGVLDLRSGEISRITDPEANLLSSRFNDGKVDRAGRLWAGTMDNKCSVPVGSLYRLSPDGQAHRMAAGFLCSNGLGWSPDNRTMYFTDSMVRTIWAYEFDLSSGSLGPCRVFARLSDDDGVPDGLTVDAEGFVWSAIWDGWRVIRYSPDGAVDREIRMPVQRPSSCMFGGTELKTLFITSACVELGWKSLRDGPLAGALFSVECEVAGLQEPVFAAE